MKQRMRFAGLLAVFWLTGVVAWSQSYTIRCVKGTDRLDRNDTRTVHNLEELVSRLSDCRKQLERGGYAVSLTALQNVVDRYDPAARSLALTQATALQEYLREACCLDGTVAFDLSVDARTDLDNRVIAELKKQILRSDTETIISPPSEEDLKPFRKRETERSGEGTSQGNTGKTAVGNTPKEAGKQTERAKVVPETVSRSGSRQAEFLLGNIGLGVKTNALLFAGLLPDGSMYSPVVNMAGEVYFLERFSAQLSFAYALPYHKGDKNNLFEMTAFVAEPRWWLRGDGSYRGAFVGIYGQYGTFDVRIKEEIEDNCTGSFFGGGLSVGWLQPVWRGLYAEASIQVGYRNDAVDVYSFTAGKPYDKLASYTLNGFTLQGFGVGVGYRF